MYKAIIFDLDDTLYPYAPCLAAGQRAAEQYLAKKLHLPVRRITTAWSQARHTVNSRLAGQAASHSRLLYIQELVEQLTGQTNVSIIVQAEKLFWNAYCKTMTLRPGVLALLRSLHRRGIKIAVVSDLTSQIQFRKLLRLKIHHYIDYVVTSEQIGVEKPNPAGLRLALHEVEVSARSALFVGDSLQRDQPVAKICGMDFFHLHTFSGVSKLDRACKNL